MNAPWITYPQSQPKPPTDSNNLLKILILLLPWDESFVILTNVQYIFGSWCME